ncbi:type II toxin-antitoxin system antitoxin SocA domain-containing protein, partial [Megamonas funiformis]|uniref:type II toxin-antitoxin system antitoxin SocA domain-containing protein n=1 Tax=Megamonas funiformis TaxID=437897 RepID=UPI00241DBCBC
MKDRERTDFCTICRKNTGYTLKKRNIKKVIREKEYIFNITVAICNECGEETNIKGLIDKNIQEVDKQYREYEDIVSIEDIKKLMKIYNLGKAPLSLALGFGEITITRYLLGQIPSKDKIAPTAFKKSMEIINKLEDLFSISGEMVSVISYIFKKLEEVTPLMLQKLLYFVQGISCVLNKKPMFTENCQAWVHGPVYPDVYELFRDFKYNPIEDVRFAIFDKAEEHLSKEECIVIDLVIDTFGVYGGKILEKITHSETPWKSARKGYEDNIPSNEIISI